MPPTEHCAIGLGNWLLFGASRRGRSHAHAGTYREDAFAITSSPMGEEPHWWALAVADGAGSCRLSRVGAGRAVREVTTNLGRPESLKSGPEKRFRGAVLNTLGALEREARLRSCDIKDLSCTLLVLFWVEDPECRGGTVFTFQAGDGLIVSTDQQGRFHSLAAQDGESFAGTTHFFTGQHVWDTWDCRFANIRVLESPFGFLAMSDGVSDDLVPYDANGPIIVKELSRILKRQDPGAELVDLLGYEKRGSFDDRTLVCAFRRDIGAATPTVPLHV
ncbi:MAG: protein phosphatase 2C domain-containing protein [Deltaproteobacteria bacterium]|nr:protein phosphatase 2C domain-containing protein [Deltaproteobacteria bacterium]